MEKLSVIIHSIVARLGLVVVLPQLLVNAGLVHQDLELAQLVNILPEALVKQFQVHGGVSRPGNCSRAFLEPDLMSILFLRIYVNFTFENETYAVAS